MTEVDLRKLKRNELLEMLLESEKENGALKLKVEELECKLENREIRVNEAGNIAQVAFELNGVFEAAQAAAQQYLDNLALLEKRQETVCTQMEAETAAKVNRLMSETKNQCETKERAVADKCAAMEQAVQERCSLMKEETKQWCADKEAEMNKWCADKETEMNKWCADKETEMNKWCVDKETETNAKCLAREKQAEEKCIALDRKAETDVEARWDELSKRLEAFYNAHVGLRELIASTGGIQRD